MTQTPKSQNRDPLSLLWVAFFFAALVGLAVSGVLPLTYDEAWTFIEFTRHGAAYSAIHYPLPNNHVAFSILEALVVPERWVIANPLWVRLGNLIVLAGLLLLLRAMLLRHLALRGLALAATVAALVLCSPLVTLYELLARGYGLGTLLLLIAIEYGAMRERRVTAAVSCALAAWTVPTFALTVPGVFLAMLWQGGRNHWMRTVQSAVLFLVLTLLLYSPILGSVLGHSQAWNANSDSLALLIGLSAALGNLSQITLAPWAGIAFLVLTLFILTRAPESASRDAATALLGTVASTLIVTGLLIATGVITTPFLRALSFAPLFVWLSLLLAAGSAAASRQIALTLLALNAAIGALLLIQRLVFGDPQQYPLLANLNPSALSRAEPQFLEDSQRLRMGWDAVPAGRLYARSYGFAIDPGEPPPLLPCIRGQFAPALANRIATTADPPGLICF